MRAQEIDKENRHLREALADCNHDCKGKEVTIKLLRSKVKDFERKTELTVQEHSKENGSEEDLKRRFETKEEELEESQLELDTKLDIAEKKVAYLQSALESTESELYDLKSKYDDDSQAKSEEMEIIVNDLDRANQRAALAETEVRHLKEQLAAAKQSLQLADQIQKAPDMERAVDVVARSSLELELAAKQKEISQLLDDIQRLQSTLTTLKESSASKIAQLEDLVNEKDRMIVELGEKLVKQQDYNDIKKELNFLKSVDFSGSKVRDEEAKEGRKSLCSTTSENSSFKVAKTETIDRASPAGLTNCSSSLDVFGVNMCQDLVPAYPITKEERTSRPSTPIARLELDRKPSPTLDQTSCHVSATLPATNSSPEPSPTAKDMIISDTDKTSLEKLQEMMRHNIDKYANDTLNTLNISRCVRELLSVHNIGQRLFAKFVLGLSQGTVSELLSKPKPWDKLTEKGRDSYRKMHAWASDDHCIFMLKSLVPRRGKESSCGGSQTFKQDDQGAEERIVQILNEAQMAMMNAKQQQLHDQQQQQKSPTSTLPNGSAHLTSTITDSRSMDSCEDNRGENGDHKSSSNHSQSGNSSIATSHNNSRRSRKYENDDIPQEMVARIYQEELAKLVGQRVEEGFRNPPDQYERTQEEIRQALTIYHQELTRLSHLMPHQNHHHPNSFNPFVANGNTFAAALGQHHNTATTNGGGHHHHLPPQECPMDATIRTRTDSNKTSSSRDEPELRHHGSAFSLVRPKTEPNTTSSNNTTSSVAGSGSTGSHKSSSSSGGGGGNSYHLHNSSPAPPPLLPLTDATNPGSGPPGSGTGSGGGNEDLTTSASPLQRMQSITNSLLSQTSVPSMPNPPQRPAKAVLPPITQQQFDQYNNLNTEDIVKKVKEQLSQYSISQRLFGESVLGLSQGSVSDLLARPKPWHMLTQKGREPFIRMKIFLEDDNAVHKLVASQYKIAPEKLMRTGGFSGVSNPPGVPQFGQNKMSPRPPETNNHRISESRQTPTSNMLYLSQNHQQARASCITPDSLPMSLTVNNSSNSSISSALMSRKPSQASKGYSQPSVYEMAALTTDLDTQIITSKIKESLMAHNIGQKIFGEVVLGLSQGSVSELLSKPKPWHMLSIKGREPFIRMQMWLNDPHNIEMLQTIKNERREANKRRRTGEGPIDSPMSQSDNQVYSSYNFAPPSPYPPAKKPRVLFTEEQKEALRLAFTLDPYPSTATIEFLASELNLSVRTITNWFHNHRMRMKQHGVISPAADEDSRKSASEISSSSPGALVPVREGLTFDPIHYRVLLNQRLAEKFREKGGSNIGPPFLGNFGGSLPFLYSPYRNCSPLSSSGDDMGTLDLSMSSHLRHSMINSGGSGKAADHGGSSTDDRSNSEMNDDSNLSQDPPGTEGSDRDSPDDRIRPSTDLSQGRGSPLRISPLRQPTEPQHVRVTTTTSGGGSSNRRKPAMPQWVDPGLELSPDSDVHTDDDDEDDDGERDRIINGVCVRQTGDFNLMLPREETIHVVPVPAPDAIDISTHSLNRHQKDSFKPQQQHPASTVSPLLASRTEDVSSRELSDNDPTADEEDDEDIVNGCSKDEDDDATKKQRGDGPTKKVFSDDGDDDSWDDAAEAKDRRKNIEKLQQRLEKEDAGDEWEF